MGGHDQLLYQDYIAFYDIPLKGICVVGIHYLEDTHYKRIFWRIRFKIAVGYLQRLWYYDTTPAAIMKY